MENLLEASCYTTVFVLEQATTTGHNSLNVFHLFLVIFDIGM